MYNTCRYGMCVYNLAGVECSTGGQLKVTWSFRTGRQQWISLHLNDYTCKYSHVQVYKNSIDMYMCMFAWVVRAGLSWKIFSLILIAIHVHTWACTCTLYIHVYIHVRMYRQCNDCMCVWVVSEWVYVGMGCLCTIWLVWNVVQEVSWRSHGLRTGRQQWISQLLHVHYCM